MDTPGNRIRELRNGADLSIQTLADKIGLTKSQLHRIELGETDLDLPLMRQIARGLNVKASELLLEEDVECRPDSTAKQVLEVLVSVPADDRRVLLRAVKDIVQIARRIAAQRSAGALNGDLIQIGRLADVWNNLDDDQRHRMLDLFTAAANLNSAAA